MALRRRTKRKGPGIRRKVRRLRKTRKARPRVNLKSLKKNFRSGKSRKSAFSKAFEAGKSRKSALRKAYEKGLQKSGGDSKKSFSASERTKKGWQVRKQKYGQSGFKWGSPGGGKYLYRRQTRTGTLGRNRRIGKGGGFKRRAG